MFTTMKTLQERLDAKADKEMDRVMLEFSQTFRELFNDVKLGLFIEKKGEERKHLDKYDIITYLVTRYKEVNREHYRTRGVTEFETQFKQMTEQFEEMIGFEDIN